MDDPYVSPLSTLDSSGSGDSLSGEVGEAVISPLYRTRGWVRFLAVLGYVVCLFFIGSGIMVFLRTPDEGLFRHLTTGIGVAYLVMAVLYFYPCYRLNQFASLISVLMEHRNEANLIAVLEAQRSFWKYLGAMTLLFFCLMLLSSTGMFTFLLMESDNP